MEKIGWLPLGGYRIGIRSPGGGYFYYAHLSSYAEDFSEGDKVKAGEILGFLGDTGYGEEGTRGKFPPHLHLGIYISAKENEEYPFKSLSGACSSYRRGRKIFSIKRKEVCYTLMIVKESCFMEIRLWRELLIPYELAVKDLVMKFHLLKKEHREKNLYSPIEQVTGRVKSINSILEKMQDSMFHGRSWKKK